MRLTSFHKTDISSDHSKYHSFLITMGDMIQRKFTLNSITCDYDTIMTVVCKSGLRTFSPGQAVALGDDGRGGSDRWWEVEMLIVRHNTMSAPLLVHTTWCMLVRRAGSHVHVTHWLTLQPSPSHSRWWTEADVGLSFVWWGWNIMHRGHVLLYTTWGNV